MYIVVFEDLVSKIFYVFSDDLKHGFECGAVQSIFNVYDSDNITEWNGEEFEPVEIGKE
jgi:hypothetical protein